MFGDVATMNVFVLWHTHEMTGGDEDSKLIGVYSSRESAEAAQARAVQLPGFQDLPGGFVIDSYRLDEDQWREGYLSDTHGSEVWNHRRTRRRRAQPARTPI